MVEEQQYDLFCTHCGQRITEDTVFCPSCGAQVSEMMEQPTGYAPGPGYSDSFLESRLKTISIIMVASAVFLLIMGIYYLATIDAQIDSMTNNPFWDSIVDAYESMGYSEDDVKDLMRYSVMSSGIIYTVTGVCLGIASACGFTRKMWMLGFVCCIIATVVSVTSIFGLIIGIIVTHYYHTTKPLFS